MDRICHRIEQTNKGCNYKGGNDKISERKNDNEKVRNFAVNPKMRWKI